MTARHFAKRAPMLRYSVRRSRSPSSPSVTVSLEEPAKGFAPVSTLMPGRIPWLARVSAKGAPHRFVIHDRPADIFGGAGAGKEYFPVGATGLLGPLYAE